MMMIIFLKSVCADAGCRSVWASERGGPFPTLVRSSRLILSYGGVRYPCHLALVIIDGRFRSSRV